MFDTSRFQGVMLGFAVTAVAGLAVLIFMRPGINDIERNLLTMQAGVDQLQKVAEAKPGPTGAPSTAPIQIGPVRVADPSTAASPSLAKALVLEEAAAAIGPQVVKVAAQLPPGVTFTPYAPFPIDARTWAGIERAGLQAEPNLDAATREQLKAEREACAAEFARLQAEARSLDQLWSNSNLEVRVNQYSQEYWRIKEAAEDWQRRVEAAKQKCNRAVPPDEYEKLLQECRELQRVLEADRQAILARDQANIAFFNVILRDSEQFGKRAAAQQQAVETWHQRIQAYGDSVGKARPSKGNHITIHVQMGSGPRLYERKQNNVNRAVAEMLADQLRADVENGMRPAERAGLEHAIERVKRFLRNHSQPPGLFHTGPPAPFGSGYRIDVEISGVYPYPGDV